MKNKIALRKQAISSHTYSSTPIAKQHVPLFVTDLTPMLRSRTRQHELMLSQQKLVEKEPSVSNSGLKLQTSTARNKKSRQDLSKSIHKTEKDKSAETGTFVGQSEVNANQKSSLSMKNKRQKKGIKSISKYKSTSKNISTSKNKSTLKNENSELQRKHKFRPGTRALMEIRHYQKRTDLLLPRLSFQKLVREVIQGFGAGNYSVERLALEALQEATEAYVVFIFEMANLCSIHARRVTLYPSDLKLAQRIRGEQTFNSL